VLLLIIIFSSLFLSTFLFKKTKNRVRAFAKHRKASIEIPKFIVVGLGQVTVIFRCITLVQTVAKYVTIVPLRVQYNLSGYINKYVKMLSS
jgi:hypothetical protein